MQIHCSFHGPQEVDIIPAACPTCLAVTVQTTVMCDNHGIQVVKAGNSCSFCTMEMLADKPLHRVHGRENMPIETYFKPKSARRVKS